MPTDECKYILTSDQKTRKLSCYPRGTPRLLPSLCFECEAASSTPCTRMPPHTRSRGWVGAWGTPMVGSLSQTTRKRYLVYKVTGGGRIVAERSRFCPRGNYLQSELVFIVSLADV